MHFDYIVKARPNAATFQRSPLQPVATLLGTRYCTSLASLLQYMRWCNTVAKREKHAVRNNVALCFVEMLRAFQDRALKIGIYLISS